MSSKWTIDDESGRLEIESKRTKNMKWTVSANKIDEFVEKFQHWTQKGGELMIKQTWTVHLKVRFECFSYDVVTARYRSILVHSFSSLLDTTDWNAKFVNRDWTWILMIITPTNSNYAISSRWICEKYFILPVMTSYKNVNKHGHSN